MLLQLVESSAPFATYDVYLAICMPCKTEKGGILISFKSELDEGITLSINICKYLLQTSN